MNVSLIFFKYFVCLESQNVQVDVDGKKVRPNHTRCTVILGGGKVVLGNGTTSSCKSKIRKKRG